MQDAATFVSDPEGALKQIEAEGNAHARRVKLQVRCTHVQFGAPSAVSLCALTTLGARPQGVVDILAAAKAPSLAECVAIARRLFHAHYTIAIAQLLHNFPADYIDKQSGAKFWSGPKRAPAPIAFDARDPLHLSFVQSAAHIAANMLGLALPSAAGTPEVRARARRFATVPGLLLQTVAAVVVAAAVGYILYVYLVLLLLPRRRAIGVRTITISLVCRVRFR